MSQQAQMLKGLLEGCIVKLISKEETYGYKICEDLSRIGFESVNEGTIYPILIRLEKKSLIQSTTKNSPLGPKRKYFTLTPSGWSYLETFTTDWDNMRGIMDRVFET